MKRITPASVASGYMSDMLTACPKCGCEDYVVYRPMPGHGDPSDTTCICPYCETEFKGVTPDES